MLVVESKWDHKVIGEWEASKWDQLPPPRSAHVEKMLERGTDLRNDTVRLVFFVF
jgi:hypothetical protein